MAGRKCPNCGVSAQARIDDILLQRKESGYVKLRAYRCAACCYLALFMDDMDEVTPQVKPEAGKASGRNQGHT